MVGCSPCEELKLLKLQIQKLMLSPIKEFKLEIRITCMDLRNDERSWIMDK